MDNFTFDWFQKQLDKRKEPKKYLLWIDDLRHIPNHYINFISHLGKLNENKQIIYKDNFYTLIFNIVNISNANENVSNVNIKTEYHI